VIVDRRGPAPLLYVCDRLNRRIQVLDLDGTFVRTVGAGQLVGPTQMAVSGTTLVVTDLLAGRLSLFDGDDRLLGHLFPHPRPRSSWDDTADGWPNARSPEGLIVRAPLRAGAFHAPHGVTAAPDGTIYVSEFAIGGRIAVLRPSA
jgi:DNA-binding beta-propeller fold protein YncE